MDVGSAVGEPVGGEVGELVEAPHVGTVQNSHLESGSVV